jgi:hypothetical protein
MAIFAEQAPDKKKTVRNFNPDKQIIHSPEGKSSAAEYSADHPYRRRRL